MTKTLTQLMRALTPDGQRRVEQRAAELITLEYVLRGVRSRTLRRVDGLKIAPTNAFTPP